MARKSRREIAQLDGTTELPLTVREVALAGYPVGLTIAPILPVEGWEEAYAGLIRDAADALKGADWGRARHDVEIVPLYARLSAAEQHRVFAPHHGRRIVLATNVAETSLTVPGIRYVVDPGTARISRYSLRTKVQRLPIEPISQASARQRAGRCGRVADGICIRLYSEEDLASRPEFTDPEILRTNLASVILQMTALGLGEPADLEIFQWWSEMIEVPVVAEGALDPGLVEKLWPVADFIAVGPEIWSADDPSAALARLWRA